MGMEYLKMQYRRKTRTKAGRIRIIVETGRRPMLLLSLASQLHKLHLSSWLKTTHQVWWGYWKSFQLRHLLPIPMLWNQENCLMITRMESLRQEILLDTQKRRTLSILSVLNGLRAVTKKSTLRWRVETAMLYCTHDKASQIIYPGVLCFSKGWGLWVDSTAVSLFGWSKQIQ